MLNQKFSEQTHFIGVIVPESVEDTIKQCRAWMQSKYSCHSGYGTPVHITLVPPFHLPDEFDDPQVKTSVCAAAADCLKKKLIPFTAHVSGFGAFAERTLFARVMPDKNWDFLRDSVYREFACSLPGAVRPDAKPFIPHLTVANRDIPSGAVSESLCHFSELNLDVEFSVQTIGVFERTARGGWMLDDTFGVN